MKTLILILITTVLQASTGWAETFRVDSTTDPTGKIQFLVAPKEERAQYMDRSLIYYLQVKDRDFTVASPIYTSKDGNYKSFVATKNRGGKTEAYFILFDINTGNPEWRIPAAFKIHGARKPSELKAGEKIELEVKAGFRIIGQ